MLAITRKNKIKEIITEKKSATVAELAKLFNITEETIRRDLSQLESEGFLKRIYGGAYIEDIVQSDLDVRLREKIMVKDKEIIANECARIIMNGNSIFLDASTTSLYIATKIKNKKITVITNSLKIANLLSDSETVRLLLVGGILDSSSLSFVGKNTENDMRQYFVDKAFISCRSIHLKTGITDSNEQQAEVRGVHRRGLDSHQHFFWTGLRGGDAGQGNFELAAALDQQRRRAQHPLVGAEAPPALLTLTATADAPLGVARGIYNTRFILRLAIWALHSRPFLRKMRLHPPNTLFAGQPAQGHKEAHRRPEPCALADSPAPETAARSSPLSDTFKCANVSARPCYPTVVVG